MAHPPADAAREDADGGIELLHRLQSRDLSAAAELIERFGSELTRAAHLHIGDAHLAADAVQETFIAAWRGARRARPGAILRAWLFGILFNQCRKISRTESRRRARERRAARAADRTGGHGSNVDIRNVDVRIERLRKAVEGLDDALREVVILRYERSFGVAETAAALGIPAGTVKSRTHSALKALRRRMEREP